MASVGTIALYFALLTTLYAILTAALGIKNKQANYLASSKGATLSSFLMVGIASFVLLVGLVQSDFRLAYVADYTSKDLSLLYKISAFWAGQAGSLLLWLLILSGIAVVIQFSKTHEEEYAGFKAVSLINLIKLFFIFLLIGISSPFKTLTSVPFDGSGLNPMLQSFGMVIHPPILFLGYSGFIVPFALVIQDLLFYHKNSNWARKSRPWVLFSWLMLSAGMITGGNWAYTELGWGGYWAWDPVENASLFPWLTSTALLHTMIMQRQKKGMELWNYLMIAVTFILTIFGTFLTRSGVIDSVHAFSDNKLGAYFLALLVGLCLLTVFLLVIRYPRLRGTRSEVGVLSKESGILLTNLLLMVIFAGVFIGTMFPLISELLLGRKISLDQVFYNQVTVPFWLALVALMGICPILSWKNTENERFNRLLIFPAAVGVITAGGVFFAGVRQVMAVVSFAIAMFVLTAVLQDYIRGVVQYRQEQGKGLFYSLWRFFLTRKQRYGAYIVHIGVIVILVGITGGIFEQEKIQSVKPGELLQIGNYRLQYDGLSPREDKGYTYVVAALKVFEGDKLKGTISSEKIFHPTYRQPATNVGILSTLRDDIYFNLAGWDDEIAHLQVSLHPLTAWIWIGSYILYFGVLVILMPQRREAE